ncbi:MAG: hemolysin family protein [Alistipes sp.]
MEVFIIIGLILLNGILSMSEIAMVSARKPRLEADAKRGSRAAKTALKLSGNPDVFLSTIQIGITLIGILTGIYSGDMLAQSFGKVLARIPALEAHSVAIAQVIIVVTVTYLTLILGELVPKRIGMSSSERVAKLVARPMNLLSKIALPFVWLLSKSTAGMLRILGINTVDGNRVTEEEIKAIIQEGAAEGEIEEVEQDIVERVFNLSDRNVGSIMTHRSDMVWLDTNATCDQVEDIVKNNLFNTYPVADGNLDSIVGVVHLKDLFGRLDEPGFTLSQVMRPAQYIPENLSVYNALDLMRRTGGRYGLVTDEFGSIEGIVTLKDIIKALLGSMPEAGEEQEIVTREDGSLLIDGQLSFYDFLAHFDMEDLYNDYNYNTLSGLDPRKVGTYPPYGRKLSWRNFDFEIVDMDGARIDKVLVTLKRLEEADV